MMSNYNGLTTSNFIQSYAVINVQYKSYFSISALRIWWKSTEVQNRKTVRSSTNATTKLTMRTILSLLSLPCPQTMRSFLTLMRSFFPLLSLLWTQTMRTFLLLQNWKSGVAPVKVKPVVKCVVPDFLDQNPIRFFSRQCQIKPHLLSIHLFRRCPSGRSFSRELTWMWPLLR